MKELGPKQVNQTGMDCNSGLYIYVEGSVITRTLSSPDTHPFEQPVDEPCRRRTSLLALSAPQTGCRWRRKRHPQAHQHRPHHRSCNLRASTGWTPSRWLRRRARTVSATHPWRRARARPASAIPACVDRHFATYSQLERQTCDVWDPLTCELRTLTTPTAVLSRAWQDRRGSRR